MATPPQVAALASGTQFPYFASCAPGIEPLLCAELTRLKLPAAVVEGGVEGRVSSLGLGAILLGSALAESLRVRLKPFVADNFHALQSGLRRLPWHAYLPQGGLVQVRVVCHKSRLFHSDAVAERVAAVLQEARGAHVMGIAVDDEALSVDADAQVRVSSAGELATAALPQQVFVRLQRDTVVTSIDASGERLHKRGYRRHVEEAPLRETLAAAMGAWLRELGAAAEVPVWDPFCGSGVLGLEWLRHALGVQPGSARTFAFERWPIHDAVAWSQQRQLVQEAQSERARARERLVSWGSDIDPKAIASAVANASAAGVAAEARWLQGDYRALAPQIPPGTAILANPPYGVRLGSWQAARRLHQDFERLLHERRDLRPVVMACADPRFVSRRNLPWRELTKTRNGGLALTLLGLS